MTTSIELRWFMVSNLNTTHKIANISVMESLMAFRLALVTIFSLDLTLVAAIAMDHHLINHHTSSVSEVTVSTIVGTQVLLMLSEEVETTWKNTKTKTVDTKYDCQKSLITNTKTMNTCWDRCEPMVSKGFFLHSSLDSLLAVRTTALWLISSCSKQRRINNQRLVLEH